MSKSTTKSPGHPAPAREWRPARVILGEDAANDRARVAIDASAAGILQRLAQLPNLAQVEVMSPAAAPPARTLLLIQKTLEAARHDLRRQLVGFRVWLRGAGRRHPVDDVQRRYTLVRLRWIGVLTQYDIFADVLSQRSERPIGLWLAGLDHLAADALGGSRGSEPQPQVICYLDRGAGAAIRRARTRLPGDVTNPVAIIRVPRERMIGTGVGSSLVHEAGHQAAAQLCLVESLHRDFGSREAGSFGLERRNWGIFRRWVSEIVADFWSVGLLGIASTLGLIEVVSLPRPFVFRVSLHDPHPAPWIRVRLSAQIGQVLHPDAAWRELADVWTARYPLASVSGPGAQLIGSLDAMTPDVAVAIADHRSESLRDRRLSDLVPAGKRRPSDMRMLAERSELSSRRLAKLRPTLALAAVGAETRSELLDLTIEKLLAEWAMAAYGGVSRR